MRDATSLFERELARHTGHNMKPKSSGFVGMMERDPEFAFDLLLATPKNTDSESNSKGSYPPLRECNMLHRSEDRATPTEDAEDDAYPIPSTPGK